jgi:hypothetical protein
MIARILAMVANRWIYYAAAAATTIAGIVHIIMAPGLLNFNPGG